MTDILICGGESILRNQIITVLGREYRIINTTTAEDASIELTCQKSTFTPPHKKNRRGKFKRSGK